MLFISHLRLLLQRKENEDKDEINNAKIKTAGYDAQNHLSAQYNREQIIMMRILLYFAFAKRISFL